jgi:hypothetical protein
MIRVIITGTTGMVGAVSKFAALSILLAFLSCTNLFAQKKTEDFKLIPPGQKVRNSLYNSI